MASGRRFVGGAVAFAMVAVTAMPALGRAKPKVAVVG